MGGSSILRGMAKPDPFLGGGCQFPETCGVDPKQTCWHQRVVYSLECSECGALYVGTTGHTLHKRCLEHDKAVRRGDKTNSMSKHFLAEHPETDKNQEGHLFKAKVIGAPNIQHNIVRYITEATTIEDKVNTGDSEVVNSRGEWGRIQLKRLGVNIPDNQAGVPMVLQPQGQPVVPQPL